MSSMDIIIMACVLGFLMSAYSWLNFLKLESVEAIRGLSKYDMSDADRILGENIPYSLLLPVFTSGFISVRNPI